MSPLNRNVATQPAGGSSLAGERRVHESAIKGLLVAAAALSVLTTVGIVVSLLSETIGFFRVVPIKDFLFGTNWTPSFTNPEYGVVPLVAGTLMLALIAIIVAVPLGLGAALYLSEFASSRTRKVFKPILEVLAGVPTIVFGYFALTFFTPTVLNDWLGLGVPVFNALSAGIVMGFMILPLMASLSEDVLYAVPRSLREAAYALGATRGEVILRVVLPAAMSGIGAAFILAMSRAIGETMIVALAAGGLAHMTANPAAEVQTMTAYMVQIFLGDASAYGVEYKSSYAVAAVLFAITLALTIVGNLLLRAFREEYE